MEMEILGTKVRYELTGQGERRVVLLHGWGCTGQMMASVAGALEPSARVLKLDFPGHGESGRPPEPWGVPEYAACLLELLERLDFLPCHVVAHSFGCRVAIWLASEDSSRFGRLVMTGAAGLRKPQSEESKKRTAEYKRLKGLCETAKKLKIFGGLPERMEKELQDRYGSEDYKALDAEMKKTFVKVVNLDLADRLPQIHCPTLLLWGTEDTATPLWMGQKMADTIPDCGLVTMQGGTHFAYLEQSAFFNQVVHHFLTEE